MFYAVKKGRVPGIYEDKDEALKQIFKFPFSEMRTFEKKSLAEKYMGKEEKFFYVVKRGHVPGIYTSKEELSEQVRGYDSPFVKTFKNEDDAKKFFLEDTDYLLKKKEEYELLKKMKAEQKKEDYSEKIETYLKDGISIHSKNICFIDTEANNGIAISLGAVIYNSEKREIVESFHSLMKYDSFKQMDSYCEGIHHITTEAILNAQSSDDVFKDFISLLKKHEVVDIFSWGNSDKVYLRKTLSDKKLLDKISPIRNVQTFISLVTRDIIVNRCWSLSTIKKIYNIEGDISHNALDDAKDLMKVYQCFQDKKEFDKEILLACSK